MDKEKTIWDQFMNIPGWLISAVTIVLVIIPMFAPFGLPVPVLAPSRDYYNAIMNVPENGVILYCHEASGFGWSDLKDATYVLFKLIYKRPVKLVIASLLPDADPTLIETLNAVPAENYGKVYGVDYVYLGYIAGEEAAVSTLADDLHSAVSVDYRGTPLSEIPMLDDINNANDIDLLVFSTSGATGHERYVRQFQVRYDTVLIEAVTSGSAVGVIPYYPNVIKGYLAGLSGAAALELLAEEPGAALKGTDIKNLGLLWSFVLIILGNIGYWGGKYMRKEGPQ